MNIALAESLISGYLTWNKEPDNCSELHRDSDGIWCYGRLTEWLKVREHIENLEHKIKMLSL